MAAKLQDRVILIDVCQWLQISKCEISIISKLKTCTISLHTSNPPMIRVKQEMSHLIINRKINWSRIKTLQAPLSLNSKNSINMWSVVL